MKLSKQMFVMVVLAMVMFLSGCDLAAKAWDDPLPGPAVFDFEAADAVADFPGLLDAFDEELVETPYANVSTFTVDDTTRVYFLDLNLYILSGYTSEVISDVINSDSYIESLGYVETNTYENTIVVTLVYHNPIVWWPGLVDYLDKIIINKIHELHYQF